MTCLRFIRGATHRTHAASVSIRLSLGGGRRAPALSVILTRDYLAYASGGQQCNDLLTIVRDHCDSRRLIGVIFLRPTKMFASTIRRLSLDDAPIVVPMPWFISVSRLHRRAAARS